VPCRVLNELEAASRTFRHLNQLKVILRTFDVLRPEVALALPALTHLSLCPVHAQRSDPASIRIPYAKDWFDFALLAPFESLESLQVRAFQTFGCTQRGFSLPKLHSLDFGGQLESQEAAANLFGGLPNFRALTFSIVALESLRDVLQNMQETGITLEKLDLSASSGDILESAVCFCFLLETCVCLYGQSDMCERAWVRGGSGF